MRSRLDAGGRLGQGLRLQGILPAEEHCMPGAGTDKTREWIDRPAPVVVLVEPQLGQNIGAAARAMANFGLSRLRLVKPREPWPNEASFVQLGTAELSGAPGAWKLEAGSGKVKKLDDVEDILLAFTHSVSSRG